MYLNLTKNEFGQLFSAKVIMEAFDDNLRSLIHSRINDNTYFDEGQILKIANICAKVFLF